jgi:hypothetical protein
MTTKFKYSGFMVPLDVILDTRLGTIAKHDPALAQELAASDYRNRKNDNFGRMDRKTFAEAYKKRDKETLQHSVVTGILPVLRDIIQSAALSSGQDKSVHPEMPKLYINLYPYVLDEEEEKELGMILVNLIRTDSIEIELFNASPEELTPEYCLERFNFMVMYSDYNAWMDLHRYELFKKKYCHIVLFAPALFDNELPSEQAVVDTVKSVGLHPLEMLEQTAKELIDLTLIDVKYFSIRELGGINEDPQVPA